MIKIIKVLAVLAMLAGSAISQDTFFSYDFEFGEVGAEGFFLVEIAELNAEGGLVGEWSGDDFQLPDPSGFFSLDDSSAGIVENPHGGTMMFIDRPIAPAQHIMNLTEPILLPGATFSATVGTRRTGGGYPREPKSYDFFGLDSNGNESFRIRILADGSRERLGYVAGGQQFDDFDTVIGEDMADDIANTGGPPFADTDDIVELKISLGNSGYVVSYNNLNGSNAWTSAAVPFNGAEAQDLAQVVLSYGGVPDVNNDQVGFIVDDLSVTGFTELLQGDFDGDADIDMNDFLALAGNLGNATSEGDFDFNGVVNLSDWLAFKAAYNAFNPPAGAQAVPEPAGAAMLYVSLLALFAGCRRSRIAS